MSTTTGVSPASSASSGTATNTVSPSVPIWVAPSRSCVVSRSSAASPAGRSSSGVSRSPIDSLAVRPVTPGATVPSGVTETSVASEMFNVARSEQGELARDASVALGGSLPLLLVRESSAEHARARCATAGARSASSVRASLTRVRLLSASVASPVNTSTPIATPTIATKIRFRSRRGGAVTRGRGPRARTDTRRRAPC